MKTEIGRLAAIELEQKRKENEKQVDRFIEVLREFERFDERTQLIYMQITIACAYIPIAKPDRASEVRLYHTAWVNMMYVETEHAAKNTSDNERQDLLRTAKATYLEMMPKVEKLWAESFDVIKSLDQKHIFRGAGESILRVKLDYLPHAPRRDLADFSIQCLKFNDSATNHILGIVSKDIAWRELSELVRISSKIEKAVLDVIKQGQLVVREGRIYLNT